MPKYALLLGGADLDKRSGNPEMAPIILQRFTAWLEGLREKRQLVSATKLRDQAGARLSVRGGQVVEGPFMEAKEAVGGIVIIEAESLEAALVAAGQSPTLTLQNGHVEVRVIEEVPGR